MAKKKRFDVLVFPSAQKDLSEIKAYYTDVLKTNSTSIFEKFLEQIEVLKTFPTVYPIHTDPFLKLVQYRVFTVDNYLVFYVIKRMEVQIHRVIYAKRNYLDLLKVK